MHRSYTPSVNLELSRPASAIPPRDRTWSRVRSASTRAWHINQRELMTRRDGLDFISNLLVRWLQFARDAVRTSEVGLAKQDVTAADSKYVNLPVRAVGFRSRRSRRDLHFKYVGNGTAKTVFWRHKNSSLVVV